ncbi:MAG: hypothetical protein ACRDL5_15820 [Solirubrobacteraceae bacterium]
MDTGEDNELDMWTALRRSRGQLAVVAGVRLRGWAVGAGGL